LLKAIQADASLRLQVIASGTHLAPKFGRTWRDIEAAGIRIDRKINLRLKGESSLDNLKSIAVGLRRFAEAFVELQPEIVVLLGDRFELLAPAISALMLQIPIAHIHGGELSEGAIDDSVRHAITKMASLHFAATEAYRRRIIQMGESPDRVFNFGAPGLDELYGSPLLTRQELEEELGFSLNDPVALVTYHPASRDPSSAGSQVSRLVAAIKASGFKAVFTLANADAQGALINRRLQAACAQNPKRFKWIPHLGHRRYLSCLKYFAVMVGNSSSGLTEAPSFRLPVVNIGDRQRGRVRAANVIDVSCSRGAILGGIKKAVSPGFRASLGGVSNPYDRFHDGRASERIKDALKHLLLSDDVVKKHFHDLR
jgi:UDP-N-acetylglucosamine 2-epimerase (non-hydrolysing)/GDP/UDP-N,N'-diacetylbacillosamine 2-epimerase (hydrolysing)